MTNSATQTPKLAYGLDEVTQLLGLGRSTVYLEIRTGRLPVTKVGRISIIMADDLAGYIGALKNGNSRQPILGPSDQGLHNRQARKVANFADN